MTTKHLFWLPKEQSDALLVDCLCLGTGRFLRSVLMPPMVAAGFHPALVQTRGTNFLEFMHTREEASYPIDTVLFSGKTETLYVKCFGAFSWGTKPHKEALQAELLDKMKRLSIIGLGVTEAGLVSAETQVMKDLYDLLHTACQKMETGTWEAPTTPNGKLVVINTDNVPNNGNLLRSHMMELANGNENDDMTGFLTNKVVFLNTMVDRITSQREGSQGLIPRCEPTPSKALVVCDPEGDMPSEFSSTKQKYGVVIRPTQLQIEGDIALKLQVANATHTAIAHAMALVQWDNTDKLAIANSQSNASSTSNSFGEDTSLEENVLTAKLFLSYLDALFTNQIKRSQFPGFGTSCPEADAAYADWRPRLTHPYFGLSTFFITQNGAAKGGIRLGPTVIDLLHRRQPLTVAMAYSFAVLLRWLTPRDNRLSYNGGGVYIGWLAGTDRSLVVDVTQEHAGTVTYADGLRHNFAEGWYEFKCACKITLEEDEVALSDELAKLGFARQPNGYIQVVRSYLVAASGGNMRKVASYTDFEIFVEAIATLYARMVAGDSLVEMLEEMVEASGPYKPAGLATPCDALVDNANLSHGRPLFFRHNPVPLSSNLLKVPVTSADATSLIVSEVASVYVIDLHTHLLPPSHGTLCLWGIDELLTYHYLVAEYFMTAPASITPESFYAMNKQDQADIIWEALFIHRSPISEACRGVVTTLVSLGLSKEVAARDLAGIRKFYASFRDREQEGAEEFSEMVYSNAGVQYAIMTNIPFDAHEAQNWRPARKEFSDRYRSALRVDPLLAGDRATIEKALRLSGYDVSLEGARQYLRDWCDTMKPEYMMASTPHDFVLQEGSMAGVKKTGLNLDAMKQPFAFADRISSNAECIVNCNGAEDEAPSVLDENSDFLSEVVMKVCEERNLPVALKIGAHRGVNPKLKAAGDGVVAFADAGMLGRLCNRFPRVLFLATFLSRNNQQEAAVLASKFRNLHVYGCWWFCNNPSIIKEITTMRIEMLGTAFTAQHSDARVLDQLLYKWPHSRAIIACVLIDEYSKLCASGWAPRREEIRRDIGRLFGGSYEAFLADSLPAV